MAHCNKNGKRLQPLELRASPRPRCMLRVVRTTRIACPRTTTLRIQRRFFHPSSTAAMCIMLTPAEPSSTRLINVPVALQGQVGYKLLLYTNDLKAEANQLMIVPIPNYSGKCEEFGLVDARALKRFRQEINDIFPKPRSAASLSKGVARSFTDELKVRWSPCRRDAEIGMRGKIRPGCTGQQLSGNMNWGPAYSQSHACSHIVCFDPAHRDP